MKKRFFKIWYKIVLLGLVLWIGMGEAPAFAAESQEEYVIGLGWSERVLPKSVKTGDTYTYQSENTKIAEVSQDGIVKGVGYGSTRIKIVRSYGKNKKETSYVKIQCKKAGIRKNLQLTITPETVQLSPYEILECARDKAVYQIYSEDKRLEISTDGTLQKITGSGEIYLQIKETYQKKTQTVGRVKVRIELPEKSGEVSALGIEEPQTERFQKEESLGEEFQGEEFQGEEFRREEFTEKNFLEDTMPEESETTQETETVLEIHAATKAPQGLTAVSKNADTISLEWKTVNCDGYELYRQERNGNFVLVKKLSAKKTSYQDSGLVTGRRYMYKLAPYRLTEKKKTVGKAAYIAGTPAVESVSLTMKEKKASLTLSWKSAKKAEKYLIFRADKKDGDYQNIAEVKASEKSTYTDTDIVPNKRYYYKVQVYAENTGLLVYGPLSKKQSGKMLAPDKVSWVAASYRAGSGLSVFWKKVKGADGYKIYSSTDGKTAWKQVAEVSSDKRSYTNTGWRTSKGVYVKVTAFCKKEEKNYEGAASPVVNGKTLFCKGYEGYSTEEKIEVLRVLFPAGLYWNHKGSSLSGMTANETCFLVSASACNHEVMGYGSCNIYNGNTRFATDPQYSVNMQCLGFASMISDFLFGKTAAITQFRGFDRIKVGDHIRLTDWDHSMIVVKKGADYIQVVECNRSFEDCLIEWDRELTRYQLERMNYTVLRK